MAKSRQERENERRHRAQIAVLGKVLNEPEGRAYVRDLLAQVHFQSTMIATNPIVLAFREGERNIGLRLGAHLEEANPEGWYLMLKEGANERRNTEYNAERNGHGHDEPDSFTDPSPSYDA